MVESAPRNRPDHDILRSARPDIHECANRLVGDFVCLQLLSRCRHQRERGKGKEKTQGDDRAHHPTTKLRDSNFGDSNSGGRLALRQTTRPLGTPERTATSSTDAPSRLAGPAPGHGVGVGVCSRSARCSLLESFQEDAYPPRLSR